MYRKTIVANEIKSKTLPVSPEVKLTNSKTADASLNSNTYCTDNERSILIISTYSRTI